MLIVMPPPVPAPASAVGFLVAMSQSSGWVLTMSPLGLMTASLTFFTDDEVSERIDGMLKERPSSYTLANARRIRSASVTATSDVFLMASCISCWPDWKADAMALLFCFSASTSCWISIRRASCACRRAARSLSMSSIFRSKAVNDARRSASSISTDSCWRRPLKATSASCSWAMVYRRFSIRSSLALLSSSRSSWRSSCFFSAILPSCSTMASAMRRLASSSSLATVPKIPCASSFSLLILSAASVASLVTCPMASEKFVTCWL